MPLIMGLFRNALNSKKFLLSANSKIFFLIIQLRIRKNNGLQSAMVKQTLLQPYLQLQNATAYILNINESVI